MEAFGEDSIFSVSFAGWTSKTGTTDVSKHKPEASGAGMKLVQKRKPFLAPKPGPPSIDFGISAR
ncbi:hypothetical protein T265_11751 [Opisthorchis viverrini]|uniref:Uncharacterized protein n=1 Tax=Opisthorchis viverrini TaxID=6198 RepID=A0A074YXG3_OPIVI|nr:hypothetical protein T265_11751 [Opisthorchis viverrini]KER19491.1 hypothetical protein T265_11751 [Opisthorchis viverrini]